MGLNSLDVY